jgi:hypothetical protein
MSKVNIGDVFRTSNSEKYAIVIGFENSETYVLTATYKNPLPSGGEVVSLTDDQFDSEFSEYDFSHNIDVSGWLEFKKKQIYKILKG